MYKTGVRELGPKVPDLMPRLWGQGLISPWSQGAGRKGPRAQEVGSGGCTAVPGAPSAHVVIHQEVLEFH